MSFSDLADGPAARRRAARTSSVDAIKLSSTSSANDGLGATLQQYDRHVELMQTLLNNVDDAEMDGEALEAQCFVLLELRNRAQRQLGEVERTVEKLSRGEREMHKARVEKLSKDLDRIRAKHAMVVQVIPAEVVMQASASRFRSSKTAPTEQARGGGLKGGTLAPRPGLSQQQQLQLQEVDDGAMQDYLIRERAGEIQRINQDLHSINEIFHDLANLVETQNESVEDIGKTMEAAHGHAARGLDQVQQASRSQQGCIVC